MPRSNRQFKPGSSGNPRGRRKNDRTVRKLARPRSLKAIETLVAIMENPRVKGATRLAAAKILLERAYGKPGMFRFPEQVKSPLQVTFRILPPDDKAAPTSNVE